MNASLYECLGNTLVTGGSGFLGTALAETLAAAGVSTQVLSRQGGTRSHPTPVGYYQGDLSIPESLNAPLKGVRTLFHCAAEKEKTSQMEAVNVTGTANLIAAASACGVERFIHVSSVGVIGRVTDRSVTEETITRPMNLYERTKERAEQLFRERTLPFSTVIARPTNIFGPATLKSRLDRSPRALLRQILKGREHTHLIYIKDVVSALLHLAALPTCRSLETFILADNDGERLTHRALQSILHRLYPEFPAPLPFATPVLLPFLIRRLKHGRTNRGDLHYSAGKLLASGFSLPTGLYKGLEEAAAILMSKGVRP